MSQSAFIVMVEKKKVNYKNKLITVIISTHFYDRKQFFINGLKLTFKSTVSSCIKVLQLFYLVSNAVLAVLQC